MPTSQNIHPGTLKIACIGEAMVELTRAVDNPNMLNFRFSGDTLNTAIYMKRVLAQTGNTSNVSFISALGQDEFSDAMLGFIKSESVESNQIKIDKEKLPGLYSISTDEHGERSFSYWRAQSAAKDYFSTSFNDSFNEFAQFDVIYYSAITLALMSEKIRKAWLEWLTEYRRKPNKAVAFDSNFRPVLWESKAAAQEAVMSAYGACDIALPSVDDEMALFDDNDEQAVLTRVRSCGVKHGVLKRGSKGPVSLNSDSTLPVQKGKIKVIDSTAAGDSFNGAYLAAVVANKPELEAMQTAHDVAAMVIGHDGAIVPVSAWNVELTFS